MDTCSKVIEDKMVMRLQIITIDYKITRVSYNSRARIMFLYFPDFLRRCLRKTPLQSSQFILLHGALLALADTGDYRFSQRRNTGKRYFHGNA